MTLRLNQFCQQGQRTFTVSQYRNIHCHILADFGRINIQMDHLRLTRISLQLAGHTVIESHSDSNQYITFIGLHVRSQISMHAQHSFVQTVIGRQGRKSQQRTAARQVCFLHKSPELFLRIAQFHSLPDKYQRLACLIDQCNRFGNSLRISLRIRIVTANKINVYRFVFSQFLLGILCKIQYNRARTSASCNIEGA